MSARHRGPGTRAWGGGMPAALVALFLLLLSSPAAAQFPGEILGRVSDAATGAAVEAALVELPASGRTALSDATGAFLLRGLEPGRHAVVVRRLGFAEWRGEAEVRNGRTVRLAVELLESAVELQGVEVTADAIDRSEGVRYDREGIRRSGARTAGDVVARAPGVLLRGQGADREQTVSIRGSGTDAVLVLVDGVPINDPVTGTADLSTVPADAIESVTVLVGAQSARFGPRAEAGVVLIRTRDAEGGLRAGAGVGSLGERALSAEAGGSRWTVGGHARGVDGAFDFERVPGIDPSRERRVNADLGEAGAWAVARAGLLGGELRTRAGVEALERGLPGKGYAPSIRARQELGRARGSLSWRRSAPGSSATVALSGVGQRVRFADPDPPFGLPYDATTRVRSLELRTELERRPTGSRWLRGYGAGLDARAQHVASGNLSDQAPRTRADAGAFAFAVAGAALREVDVELAAEARLDRDALAERWYPNRALTLRATRGRLSAHLSNRSGYSPPSLGDQFFREGVAVAPNPDLQAERIPSEWEAGLSAAGRIAGAEVDGGGEWFQGDIRGMILWLPDFRFVWSPQNTDVRRWGMESWAEAAWSDPGLRLRGSYSLAAVTYDRAGESDTVQVAYRPRHSAQLRAEWTRGPWRADAGALLTGTRFPAPAPLNALSAFWTLDAGLGRTWTLRRAEVEAALHVDRLLDERGSMIFGFPEAGRRIRLDVRVQLADRT